MKRMDQLSKSIKLIAEALPEWVAMGAAALAQLAGLAEIKDAMAPSSGVSR